MRWFVCLGVLVLGGSCATGTPANPPIASRVTTSVAEPLIPVATLAPAAPSAPVQLDIDVLLADADKCLQLGDYVRANKLARAALDQDSNHVAAQRMARDTSCVLMNWPLGNIERKFHAYFCSRSAIVLP